MEMTHYISFLLASAVLIAIPGPNVLVIVSTSVSHGTSRGLQTVLGTSSAMIIQLWIAALGTAWLVETLRSGFAWLRWFGVGYLLYLGLTHFYRMLYANEKNNGEAGVSGSFCRGFLVSLTNPKTILFFSAFLPQFVSAGSAYMPQIAVLSVSFLILATVLDSCYAILAGGVSGFLRDRKLHRIRHGVSSTIFLGASAWLALMRK